MTPSIGRRRNVTVVDNSHVAKRVGDRIKQARTRVGLTQAQVAAGRYTAALFGAVSVPRLVAIALLGAFVPVALAMPPLIVAIVATVVIVGVAVYETLFHPASAVEGITVEGA